MKRITRFLVLIFVSVIICAPIPAQNRSGNTPGKHRGAVTALLRDNEGRILSAGEDGFLEIWDGQKAMDRYQLSPHRISAMALRPGKPQITIVESDGFTFNRVSAWNYETKENLFSLRFRDRISYLNYSAAGSFVIVVTSEGSGVVLIHSETGRLLESAEGFSGAVALAATSQSERTMVAYLSSGILSYWDLVSGAELQNLDTPPGIKRTLLFGNSRFIGGFDSRGLLMLDAVTGTVLARDENIREGQIFTDNPASSRFYCLFSSNGLYAVNQMEIDFSGRLSTISRKTLPETLATVTCAVSGDRQDLIMGTDQGTLWLLNRSAVRIMDTETPEMILDAAASSSDLGFISEGGALVFIPLDYSLLANGGVLTPEDAGVYTNIVSDKTADSRFLLWHPGRTIPVLKTLENPPKSTPASQFFLGKLPLRSPLRSAALLDGNILFLNTTGTVSVLNSENGDVRFSHSAAGSTDAAFIDQDTIILSRSAAAGGTPFMVINILTGETVHLPYPAPVGIRVFRAAGGSIYGAVVSQSSGNAETSLLRLDTSNPANSEMLVQYNGEETSFALAESGGNLIHSLGNEGIIHSAGTQSSESFFPKRSMGLPQKIIDGGRWFIVLDGEGGIAWHDNRTGQLQAVFRLYPEYWVLERTEQRGTGMIIRGSRTSKQQT
jgi:WD40 repeat protein